MRKHRLYLWYVLRHKWFVFLACLRYGLIWAGIVHDLSKLRPDEWGPYAEYFYGDKEDPLRAATEQCFDVAWNYHQKRNPHHWQFWVLLCDDGEVQALRMPLRYRREMLADWHGAGRAILGDTANTTTWYRANRDRMTLHPVVRAWVERELGI